MAETTLDILGNRLGRLERENRRLKHLGVGLLVGMVAVGLLAVVAVVRLGQAGSEKRAKVVEAEKIVLRDASGKIRAELGLSADGSPRLDFFDRDEKRRAGLFLVPDGARLYLADKTGTLQAALAMSGDSPSVLQLLDKAGTVRWRAP